MTTDKKASARLAPGGSQTTEKTSPKVATDRRELQGIATGRNGDQPAPAWPTPCGAVAAADLGRALSGWTLMLGREPMDPTKRVPK